MKHLFISPIVLVGAIACGSYGSEIAYNGTDPSSGEDAGPADALAADSSSPNEGGGSSIPAPADCDLTKAPKDSPACLSDTVGIFVAPSGNDEATGRRDEPVKSIARAIEIAGARGLPRVYVCAGTYSEGVEIKTTMSLFGGLTCAWSPAPSAKVTLAPPKGIALHVAKAPGPVFIEDFEVVGAADLSVPGDSAIAVFVSESNVTLRRVSMIANAGSRGANGSISSNYMTPALDGQTAPVDRGGRSARYTCLLGGSSRGGIGGTSETNDPAYPGDAAPPSPNQDDNRGITGELTCEAGRKGGGGAPGAAGIASSSPGTLTANGWDSSAIGTAGANGKPGQGGGGGGGKRQAMVWGGGGAAGGCGGAGGHAGANGGSSFALLAFNSKVNVEAGSVTAGAGGDGGAGGAGQAGQSGGTGGASNDDSRGGCHGGDGGAGAGGSGGGGGAGGHSIPIAFIGIEPKVVGAKLTPAAPGLGGDGGQGGPSVGNAGRAGVPGPQGKSPSTLAL